MGALICFYCHTPSLEVLFYESLLVWSQFTVAVVDGDVACFVSGLFGKLGLIHLASVASLDLSAWLDDVKNSTDLSA